MGKKLNKYRIKQRLERAFVVASGIPALAAVATLVIMIVVANVYAGALRDSGFSSGCSTDCPDRGSRDIFQCTAGLWFCTGRCRQIHDLFFRDEIGASRLYRI